MHRKFLNMCIVLLNLNFAGGDVLPAKIKPGATPGVRTLGHTSYFSPICAQASGKIFDHEVSLIDSGIKPSLSSRKLLTSNTGRRKKSTKIRPPAWLPQQMNARNMEEVDRLIRYFSTNNNYCPFLTKNCVVPGRVYVKFLKKSKKLSRSNFSEVDVSQMMNVRQGSWGNCALVGLADTMLRQKSGLEIDNHDVVIRLGELPLRKYRSYVGTKTDVTWTRRRGKMAARGTISTERPNVRLYVGSNNGNTLMPTLQYLRSLRMLSQKTTMGEYLDFPAQIYKLFLNEKWNKGHRGKKKDRVSSTGFQDAIDLIFSRFCKRVDLYGFSSNCGGGYHNVNHLMQTLHNCELESWVLHHIMKQYTDLGVCVYT